MIRKFIDCRDVPGAECTVAIFAESEDELLEAAIQHAVTAHGCKDTPELRERLRTLFKTEKRRAICGWRPVPGAAWRSMAPVTVAPEAPGPETQKPGE